MKKRDILLRQLIILFILLIQSVVCQEVQNNNENQISDGTEICQICKCSNVDIDNSKSLQINCISRRTLNKLSFSKMIWPEMKSGNIIISVEDFDMISVEKLPQSQDVVSLLLKNNNIRTTWPMAFSELTNLETLSLANNQLIEVTPDMFDNLKKLLELDLSNNKLSVFNNLDFNQLKSLKTLVLNGNQIENVPILTLNGMVTLEHLYLANNKIFFLNFDDQSEYLQVLQNIKTLDFSYNKLTVITKNTFNRAKQLKYLNLSYNHIKNIDIDAFKNCLVLDTIDLSSNEIKVLATFPPSIQMMYLSQNFLTEWPSFPESLTVLDISKNELYNMYNENDVTFDNLQVLNMSWNKIQNFEIKKTLSKLLVLDISFNSLKTFPKSLDSNLIPSIEDLYVDGNPIEDLVFENTLYLKKFSASYLNRITSIRASSLKIKHRNSETTNSQQCVNVFISHCDKLFDIEENSFSTFPICHLDLSFNNLKALHQIEGHIKNGINLQGNPWNCDCSLQWMLDYLLEDLFSNHSALLHELRCHKPRQYQGMRFVHWHKRSKDAFCSDEKKSYKFENYKIAESTSDTSDTIFKGNTTVAIILCVAIIILFIVVGALVTYLLTGKCRQKKNNERRIKNRKRQNGTDFHTRLTNTEQTVLTSI